MNILSGRYVAWTDARLSDVSPRLSRTGAAFEFRTLNRVEMQEVLYSM